MQSSSQLTVDLGAVRNNMEAISAALPKGCQIMPMVKAAAYGTDSLSMAKFFQNEGVPYLGVSMVSEGILLRENGIISPIFVICAPAFEADLVVKYHLEAAIGNEEEALALNAQAALQGKIAGVHLSIDTGLNRFGCRMEECEKMMKLISKLTSLKLQGIMTHLKAAESIESDLSTRSQLHSFESILQKCNSTPQWIHAANSAGALRWEIPFCNLVRVGLALYGIYSSPFEKTRIKLTSALELKTTIATIREGFQGETVGYGFASVIKKKRAKIAVLSIGYHDGIHGHFSEKGYVIIHNKKAPMVGKICMDYMMVDITDIPEAKVGDQAEIFGRDLPAEKLAEWGNINVRELICCLGPRVKRVFEQSPHPHHIDNRKEQCVESFT